MLAIAEAGQLLRPKREALVLTVWQPFDVGFLAPGDVGIDAANAAEVRRAAERTATAGASLAQAAGFQAQGLAVEAAPAWKGIVRCADEHDASLIVLGAHGRTGLAGVLVGSVSAAVASHSSRSVLIVHQRH